MKLKKILSILLSITMLLSPFTITGFYAYADELTTGSCGDNVTYSFDASTGTLTLSGTGPMTGYTYGNSPFYENTSIKKVVVENGVTTLCFYAFNSCSELTEVTIPESLTGVGYGAFNWCPKLERITVSENNPVYDSRDNCNAIIRTADNALMVGCKNTVIPNTVTSIAEPAFYGCSQMTSITIPDSVTSIGAVAFYRCQSLTSITIPDSVTTIGGGAFLGCKKINHFVVPDSVESIGENAFSGMESSERDSEAIRMDSNEYVLPIAKSVLYQNTLYARFDKPYVKFNGKFSECFKLMEAPTENLMNIAVGLQNKAPKSYYILGGQLINGNWVWQYSNSAIDTENKWASGQPSGGSEAQFALASSDGKYHDISISSTTPGFIASVDLNAVESCISNSNTYKTNKYVYYNASLPFSVAKYICERNGGYLVTLTSEAEKTSVNELCGNNNTLLGAVRNASNNFEWVNGESFSYSNWRENEPNNYSSMGGQYYVLMSSVGEWDDICDLTGGATSAEADGFVCEYKPDSVQISVDTTGLTDLTKDNIKLKATYPDGSSSFIETKSISIVKVNNITYNVTVQYENEKGEEFSVNRRIQLNENKKCGENAYYFFDGETKTLTISGEGDIYNFSNSASAHFADYYSDIKTVNIESGITSIGNNTFNECSALENVNISDTVQTIGSESFSNCSSLTELTIPESVTVINRYAFYNCSALSKLVLPKNTAEIGKSAFLGCSAMQSLTVYNYYADIYDNVNTIPAQTVIKGCVGSAAQNYAEKYERAFEAYEHQLTNETVAPNCTERGYTEALCSLCGFTDRYDYTEPNGHSYDEGVIIQSEVLYNVIEYTCSVCGDSYTEQAPVAHTHTYVAQNTVEPNCTEEGYTVYECSACGATFTEEIPPKGHTYTKTNEVEAMCTQDGYLTYTCSLCGDEYRETVAAAGHIYNSVTVGATCTQWGYTQYECTVCDNTYVSNYTAPMGHSLSDYVFNNDSAEFFDGSETAICSRCSMSFTRNVAPTAVYSDNIEANAGDVISIPVYLKNNTNLAGFGFEFEYDESVLTPLFVTGGTLIQSGLNDNLDGDAVSGRFKTIWYGTENIENNGNLINLNFEINNNAKNCDTTIRIECLQDDTFNDEFENVEIVCHDISVGVSNDSEATEYNGVLNMNKYEVTAGDVFFVSLGENGSNVSLTEAVHCITYNVNGFSFIGYADDNMHSVSTNEVRNTGSIEIVNDSRGTYNSYTPDEIFETLGIKYLIFKANDYAKSGEYEFNYEITGVENIDVITASGCTVRINASAVSEVANIYIENGISAEYNDTVTIPINISNNKGIMGYRLNVEYNPEQLEIVMAQRGTAFTGNFNDTIGVDEEGGFSVLWNGTDDVSVDGVLLNLTFRVLTDEYVVSPITITYSQDDTFNSVYDDVVFNCISGSINLNEEESHQFIDEVVAPTPDLKGYTKHTCANCGYSYTDSETEYANDMSALEAALEKVTEYNSSDYSTASYQQLQSVYSTYLDYPNRSIPQTTIDNATSEILTAISNLVPYLNLTVKGENGTVSVSDYDTAEKYSVLFGETVTLTATADEGYVFDGWYETVTKRIRSNNETFTFRITSNTDFEARFIKEQSATLTFENESGWIAGMVSKTVSEWSEVTTIDDLLPNVPYKLGYTNGRWVYDNAAVIQKLQNGENVTIMPEYDATDYENPVIPTPLGDEPALDLYYQLDADNNVGSFTMAAGFTTDCQVESIGIAFYYKKADAFDPTAFDLNINNKMTTSKFEASNEDGIYTVDVKKFTSYYNWSARGYVTYYDKDGNLKVAYSNQINIIDREQIG